MRWLFLLLVVLNIFYYIWHHQEAPLRAKEVISLSLYKGSQQDIRLLSEARPSGVAPGSRDDGGECLYLGGFSSEDVVRQVQRKLTDVDIHTEPAEVDQAYLPGYAFKIAQESKVRVTDMVLQGLANEFNELKYKKMRCEGLRPPNSLHRMAPAPQ